MELRHLRYFVAVAEELNFRRAAERLHLAAPTLSQQIKDLEDSVGARLFERDTTSVRLTGPGELFLAQVRLVLDAAARAVALAREAAQGRRGRLCIGNAGALTHGFMPACLQAFGKKFPDVEVTLVEIDLNAQVAAVAAGAIEIGFTLRKEPAALKGLQHTVVVCEPLTVLLSADHPFGKLRRVPIAELAGQRLLAVGGQKISSHSDLIKSVLTMCGVAAGAPRTVNGYEAFLAMVASGQGISLLPRMPSHGAVAGLTTRPLKEAHPALVLEARAVWRDARAAPIVNNFVEIMRATRPRASRPGAESRSA